MKEGNRCRHKQNKLTKDHRIPQFMVKIFPRSIALREAVNSPENIQILPRKIHDEVDRELPKIYKTMKEVFKNGYKETVIYRK